MSIDFLSDNSIKPWMNVGANTVSSNNYMLILSLNSDVPITTANTIQGVNFFTNGVIQLSRGGATLNDFAANGAWTPLDNPLNIAVKIGDFFKFTFVSTFSSTAVANAIGEVSGGFGGLSSFGIGQTYLDVIGQEYGLYSESFAQITQTSTTMGCFIQSSSTGTSLKKLSVNGGYATYLIIEKV